MEKNVKIFINMKPYYLFIFGFKIQYASVQRLLARLLDVRFMSVEFLNTFLTTHSIFTSSLIVLETIIEFYYTRATYTRKDGLCIDSGMCYLNLLNIFKVLNKTTFRFSSLVYGLCANLCFLIHRILEFQDSQLRMCINTNQTASKNEVRQQKNDIFVD